MVVVVLQPYGYKSETLTTQPTCSTTPAGKLGSRALKKWDTFKFYIIKR